MLTGKVITVSGLHVSSSIKFLIDIVRAKQAEDNPGVVLADLKYFLKNNMGQTLEETQSFAAYNVQNETTLTEVLQLRGGAPKRGRSGTPNPFVHDGRPVTTADVSLFQNACNNSVTLQDDQDPDFTKFFREMPDECKVRAMKFLTHGKHTNDLKVKLLVGMLPKMEDIKKSENKLKGSFSKIEKKFAAKVWTLTCDESQNQKFNMDVLKVMLKNKSGFTDPYMEE